MVVTDGEGYTSLTEVTKVPPAQRDNMESFWLLSNQCLSLFISPIFSLIANAKPLEVEHR